MVTRGNLILLKGREDHTTEISPLLVLTRNKRGESATAVTNGCATKFFTGSFYGLPIFVCRTAWKVY